MLAERQATRFRQQRGRVRNNGRELTLRAMRDLLTALGTALGLVLVIEGVLYALFPEGMKRAAARALLVPPQALRLAGLAAACVGVAVVWLVRR